MKKSIPYLLIYFRLFAGLLIIGLSFQAASWFSGGAIILLSAGLLSDIADGIVARYLGVSSEKLRRLDSSVDQVFFISVCVATYIRCPQFFIEKQQQLLILLAAEAACYLICFLKFRKEVATHSIGAKLWTLSLFATLVQLILQCQSGLLFAICFWLGLITRLEIAAIILVLKKWANDVPTLFHAFKLRNNKAIRRHKLFNG